MINAPHLIPFQKTGKPTEGFLTVCDEAASIGFSVERLFWTYGTPREVSRGRHAHYETEMILIAVAGEIEVTTETVEGVKERFYLQTPDEGLYLPKLCWHEMFYSETAVQLVLCSTAYDEKDYIRSRKVFNKLVKQRADV